jgi:hypothetical protein
MAASAVKPSEARARVTHDRHRTVDEEDDDGEEEEVDADSGGDDDCAADAATAASGDGGCAGCGMLSEKCVRDCAIIDPQLCAKPLCAQRNDEDPFHHTPIVT